MSKIFHTLGIVALALGSLAAQATPVEQWQIIEGRGLTDDAVFLGQPRKQLVQRSKTCKKPATECTFRIAPSIQDITVYFNAKNKVERIRFAAQHTNFNCSTDPAGFTWPTSRGVHFYDRFFTVQAAYPGSTLQCGGGVCVVDAPKDGLRFEDRHRFEDCFDDYNGTFEITPKQP
jgi:hypothetical protein